MIGVAGSLITDPEYDKLILGIRHLEQLANIGGPFDSDTNQDESDFYDGEREVGYIDWEKVTEFTQRLMSGIKTSDGIPLTELFPNPPRHYSSEERAAHVLELSSGEAELDITNASSPNREAFSSSIEDDNNNELNDQNIKRARRSRDVASESRNRSYSAPRSHKDNDGFRSPLPPMSTYCDRALKRSQSVPRKVFLYNNGPMRCSQASITAYFNPLKRSRSLDNKSKTNKVDGEEYVPLKRMKT